MQKLKSMTLILGMISVSLILSCSSDESVDLTNQITFDGNVYIMTSGLVSDYGAYAPLDNNTGQESHYNFDFVILDAPLEQLQDGSDTFIGPSASTTIVIYIELFSPGTSTFQAGTFNYIDEDNATQADIDGEFFFSYGEIELDTDGVVNGDLDGPEYELTGGSVVVEGSGNTDYTITYNLTTTGGRSLSGTYTGEFTYSDER